MFVYSKTGIMFEIGQTIPFNNSSELDNENRKRKREGREFTVARIVPPVFALNRKYQLINEMLSLIPYFTQPFNFYQLNKLASYPLTPCQQVNFENLNISDSAVLTVPTSASNLCMV